ncbi:hypothetical protein PPL_09626 [Heterostelium album PN500]|uniref:Purple acid phosphatase n=1 Tax=Heterostelium pallidum (strain ATCC 26659 / Pp 5 / PN500) TaxID=670386 RepID=D3BNV5_HETP5|nr:hypothetical protein PPL_09626 [Heterostelium album PN500]EFA76874.1 hypothetical protein PPL_09626 [Heterostelium album PN500]|eukprot:XP_020429006.1 hypothetical protein PPL_09626 [Heterostelium album PN500]
MSASIMKIMATVLLAVAIVNASNVTPLSIKLSLTDTEGEMQVTWFTLDSPSSPCVQFDNKGFNPSDVTGNIITGSTVEFNEKLWSGYTSVATISPLASQQTYYYAVGNKETGVWSELYNFTTSTFPNTNSQVTPFSFVTYGDMGAVVDNSTVRNIVRSLDQFQFVLHVGDIAYADLQDGDEGKYGNQTVWNEFLEEITPISATIPYMTCPGNHDIFDGDNSNYQNTFMMPKGSDDGDWYSFDYNGVHFVGISSETDYSPSSDQITWLTNELQTYRKSNPDGWLIVFAHRPLYCTSTFGWCKSNDKDRMKFIASLEDLFYKYNVNFFIGGHSHEYERMLPVYKSQVYGSNANPQATVYVVIGTGGCQEGLNSGFQPQPVYSSGVRLLETGYAKVSFLDSDHMQWQFIQDQTDTVLDSVVIGRGQW